MHQKFTFIAQYTALIKKGHIKIGGALISRKKNAYLTKLNFFSTVPIINLLYITLMSMIERYSYN